MKRKDILIHNNKINVERQIHYASMVNDMIKRAKVDGFEVVSIIHDEITFRKIKSKKED